MHTPFISRFSTTLELSSNHATLDDIRQTTDSELRRQAEERLCAQADEERTAELDDKNSELERFNKLFVGRELKMVELKERIKELEEMLGRMSL